MPRIFFASKSTVDKSNTVLDIVFHQGVAEKTGGTYISFAGTRLPEQKLIFARDITHVPKILCHSISHVEPFKQRGLNFSQNNQNSNPVRVVNNLQGEGKGDSLERVCE